MMQWIVVLITVSGLIIISGFLLRRRRVPVLSKESDSPPVEGLCEPAAIVRGLALYRIGVGKPLLLFPYPHASTRTPMAQGALAGLLSRQGWSVVTFDPPRSYNSTRQADFTLQEMLSCAEETLDHFGITDPVPVVGHSMGAFCALAWGIERPQRTSSLVLVCGNTGFPSVQSQWFGSERIPFGDLVKMTYYGARQITRTGNLAIQKRMANLVDHWCYVDSSLFTPEPVILSDSFRPSPPRSAWMDTVRREDYSARVSEIDVPTLILSGTNDILSSEALNRSIHDAITGSRLFVFRNSRHYPFIEEESLFLTVLENFAGDSMSGCDTVISRQNPKIKGDIQ